jgi:carbon monoxide dehydrogenase subunit G
MAAGQVEITVGAAPDDVWAKVGDFGAVGEMFPDLESFRLEGDDRVIGMFGIEIRERLVDRDEVGRSITYSVVGGVPLERHQATMSVEPDGAGSRVVWAFDVVPDEMAPIFADTYQKGLQALQAGFGGSEPAGA